jgi:hypothetical protein
MQKNEPICQISIQTRFEDKGKKSSDMNPVRPELNFQFPVHFEANDDKDKFNKIVIIGKSGNFEEV